MRISHELLAKKEKKKHRMYAAYPAVLDHTHTHRGKDWTGCNLLESGADDERFVQH